MKRNFAEGSIVHDRAHESVGYPPERGGSSSQENIFPVISSNVGPVISGINSLKSL